MTTNYLPSFAFCYHFLSNLLNSSLVFILFLHSSDCIRVEPFEKELACNSSMHSDYCIHAVLAAEATSDSHRPVSIESLLFRNLSFGIAAWLFVQAFSGFQCFIVNHKKELPSRQYSLRPGIRHAGDWHTLAIRIRLQWLLFVSALRQLLGRFFCHCASWCAEHVHPLD